MTVPPSRNEGDSGHIVDHQAIVVELAAAEAIETEVVAARDGSASLSAKLQILEDAIGAAAGTDHGGLTGLGDDDHTIYSKKASNLSDLASASSARTNLGLGSAATKNVGTGSADVAAGDAPAAAAASVHGEPLGLTGAVSATRYVGGTASGAPTTGSFAVGDFVVTHAGEVIVCTVAGTPGTWVTAGGGGGGGGGLDIKTTSFKALAGDGTEGDSLVSYISDDATALGGAILNVSKGASAWSTERRYALGVVDEKADVEYTFASATASGITAIVPPSSAGYIKPFAGEQPGGGVNQLWRSSGGSSWLTTGTQFGSTDRASYNYGTIGHPAPGGYQSHPMSLAMITCLVKALPDATDISSNTEVSVGMGIGFTRNGADYGVCAYVNRNGAFCFVNSMDILSQMDYASNKTANSVVAVNDRIVVIKQGWYYRFLLYGTSAGTGVLKAGFDFFSAPSSSNMNGSWALNPFIFFRNTQAGRLSDLHFTY